MGGTAAQVTGLLEEQDGHEPDQQCCAHQIEAGRECGDAVISNLNPTTIPRFLIARP